MNDLKLIVYNSMCYAIIFSKTLPMAKVVSTYKTIVGTYHFLGSRLGVELFVFVFWYAHDTHVDCTDVSPTIVTREHLVVPFPILHLPPSRTIEQQFALCVFIDALFIKLDLIGKFT